MVVTLTSEALGGETQLALSLTITSVVIGLLSLAGFGMAMRNAPRPVADTVVA